MRRVAAVSVGALESHRIFVTRADVDGLPFPVDYGHVFVVVRDDEVAPGPTDWEVSIRSDQLRRLRPDRHDLSLAGADGVQYRGQAIVRFSDGHRHLFRGDGDLDGFSRESPD